MRFPQVNLGHFVLKFVLCPKHSGTQIVAKDSHSNRQTSEYPERTLCVYSIATSKSQPSPLHPRFISYFPQKSPIISDSVLFKGHFPQKSPIIIDSVLFEGHFPQKSPVISGSFAQRDLLLQVSYTSSASCLTL